MAFVYLPAGAPDGAVTAQLFVFDAAWGWHDSSLVTLRPGEWVAVHWDLRDRPWPGSWREVRLQFNNLPAYYGEPICIGMVTIEE